MGDKDVDAQFADIVAHWDEVAVPPEYRHEGQADGYAAAPPADAPPAEEPTTEPPGSPGSAGSAGSPGSSASPGPSAPTGLGPGVNPPPELGFVVWRGATTPAGGRDDGIDKPHELDTADDEDDHFVPGPTAPLPPQEDLHFWGIIVGLVAGPLLLLWLVIFRPAVSGWWTVGALGLTVGGFVLLVMRQPNRGEDDPDDGARI